MSATEVVALAGVCVAAIGYVVKYLTDIRLAQRDDRLARINRQLSEFYGPLLALTRSSDESWRAFRRRYRTGGGSFWKTDPPLTHDDVMAWRLWMTTVFVPVHQRTMELVLEHADLIDEPDMPACLLAVCAHVNGYQAVLKEWEMGDISLEREANLSVVNFPGEELAAYASSAFRRLKAEQNKLLGANALANSSSRGHR